MQRRISNPDFHAGKNEGISYLDRLNRGRNSLAAVQTGATSGAALRTEMTGADSSQDYHTRKQSVQHFSSLMGGESAAFLHDRSGFQTKGSPELVRDPSVQMNLAENLYIDD